MRLSRGIVSLASAFALIAAVARSQVNFDIGFDGPASLSGPTGSVQEAVYFCTLTQVGPEPGSQGWSIIIQPENATITEISLIDTDAEELRRKEPCVFGELEFPGSFVTNQMGNGMACSAVVLSNCTPVTTPVEGTTTLARIVVQAQVPECGGSFGLSYIDAAGCFAGAASTNVITRTGASNTFANGLLSQSPLTVDLVSTDACDPATLLEGLIETLAGMEIRPGVKQALAHLLNAALRLLTDANPHNERAAAIILRAFILVVGHLPPAVIAPSDAATLIEGAQQVLDALQGD